MTNNISVLNPLEWDGGYWNRTPVWPREPDVAVIKTLAKHHLSSNLRGPIDDVMLEISFFAEGAFNKLYLVSYNGHNTSYLFRATLPVIPFFKTESEVATLAYLRARTSIPVAQVIAWDSNAGNDLGFEWMLMEKLGGVELGAIWRKIPWQRKLELVDDIAGFLVQLQTQKFGSVGSLYFKSALADAQFHNGLTQTNPNDATDPERKATSSLAGDEDEIFAIGPIFSSLFYFGSRLYLPGHRGPYRSSSEWLKAEIEIQLAWVKAGPLEGDPDYDEDFEDEAPDMMTECYRYLDVLPAIFPEEEDQLFSVLHHHDLSSANILVDPETFNITGIVDWEMVNILPIWRATDRPELLKDIEPDEEDEEPPIPSYDDEQDLAVYKRDQWDNRILRNRFDETTERLRGGSGTLRTSKATDIKRDFASTIVHLCDNIEYAQGWLEKNKARIAEAPLLEQRLKQDEDEPSKLTSHEEMSPDETLLTDTSVVQVSESIPSLKVEDSITPKSDDGKREVGPFVDSAIANDNSSGEGQSSGETMGNDSIASPNRGLLSWCAAMSIFCIVCLCRKQKS